MERPAATNERGRVDAQALPGLDLGLPLIGAPMAGGPSTVELVTAVAAAGGLGFLAGGYRTAAGLADQIGAVRARTGVFGVNLFAPNPQPVDPAAFHRYARAIQPEAARYGLDLTGTEPVEDDDSWHDKIGLLVADPVPVVSFTFGIPDPPVVARLRAVDTFLVQTVTSAGEARAAAVAGVDALVVQGGVAGAHSGTLTPDRPVPIVPLPDLVAEVAAAVRLPIVGAGGLGTTAGVAAVLGAGAAAVMIGTVLLRTDESGASAVHRSALGDPDRHGTVVTRAFTGRPARALRNLFTDRYGGRAPAGYPAVHHLTAPLRRAAAAAGDPELVNLWAGTGYRHARAEPVADTLERIAAGL